MKMIKKNMNILKNMLFMLLMIYIMILSITYYIFKSYAIEENEAKLQDLLMHNKALHTYVEDTLKPVIYKLKDLGKIEKEFFDPKILSFTYMSRNIMDEYNKQRQSNQIEEIKYKLASNNPRNPLNRANTQESEILNNFNNSDEKKYHYHFTQENREYILYTMPVTKNVKSCMRCHGDPKDSPKDLTDIYGDKAGFYEKLGDIRAILSLTMPLNVELNKMNDLFKIFALLLFILLSIVYIIIYYFVKELNKKDEKLMDKANKDALTRTFNRHVFNKDMEDIIESKNSLTRYLMILDIDHFKKVNDTYGHSVGDTILIELCQTISTIIRDTDKLYRIGGEEFAILSIQTDREDEIKFANRLREEVKSKNFENIGTITISIGITQQQDGDSYKTLFERADKALYNAKRSGRDNVQVI